MIEHLRSAWAMLRRVSGDDAYERYLAHHRRTHGDVPPLNRAAFFRAEQRRKWQRINRCC